MAQRPGKRGMESRASLCTTYGKGNLLIGFEGQATAITHKPGMPQCEDFDTTV